MFIKHSYLTWIDDHFSGASFFKPTGDGLLLIFPYTEKDLREVAARLISNCMRAVREFSTIAEGNAMINFVVPTRIGIGVARGTASRLVSGNKILDYSGRVLNLANRLMDVARPSGVVFDDTFGIELLSVEDQKLFSKGRVYLRGIAETSPVTVYFTHETMTIAPNFKRQLTEIHWGKLKRKSTLKRMKQGPSMIRYSLRSEPSDPSEITLVLSYPLVIKGRRTKRSVISNFRDFSYHLEAGRPELDVSTRPIITYLEGKGIKDSWEVGLTISYPER